MIPTRKVKKALALPLKSELTRMVVKTWKPGIAPPTAPSDPGHHGLNHLVQLEIVELSRDERGRRHVGVKMGQFSQGRPLIVEMGDPPDHARLSGQNEQSIQPAALGDGRGQEDRRRHLLDDRVGVVIQDPERVLDAPAVDRADRRRAGPEGWSPAARPDCVMCSSNSGPASLSGGTSGCGMRRTITTGTPISPP